MGQSGIWVYKKYSNGIIELDAGMNTGATPITTPYGGIYRSEQIPVLFPTDLGITDLYSISYSIISEGVSFMSIAYNTLTLNGFNIYIGNGISATLNPRLSFHVVGTWE